MLPEVLIVQADSSDADMDTSTDIVQAMDSSSQTLDEQEAMIELVVDTLSTLQAFPDGVLKQHMHEIFPSLCRMIRCRAATVQMQVALSDLFASKLGHFM